MYELYINALMVVIFIFEGACMNLMSFELSEIKLKKHGIFRYSSGIVWSLCEITEFFSFMHPYGLSLVVEFGVSLLVMTTFSVIINRGSFLKRIFPAVIFIAIRELSAQTSACITGLGDIVTKPVYYLGINGIISVEYFSVVNNIVYSVFLTGIGAVRIILIYIIIRKISEHHSYGRDIQANMKICIIPAAAGIVTTVFIKLIIFTFENGYTVVIYSRYPLLYLIIPILSLTLLISIVITFKQCQDMTVLQAENAEKIILENQITQMQNSLSETERLYDSIRSVKHDIKNNMTVMRSLLEKKCPNDNEINQYFDEMLISVLQLDSRVHTGNAVCDSVINGKFCYAEKMIHGIKLDGEGFIYNNISCVKAYDAGIILNNGLDNAIEACMKMRISEPEKEVYITVRSFRKRKMFFIEIENSFNGFLKKDNSNGLLLSTKEEPELHGIGLRNIKKCAEKYSGGIDLIAEDNRFILTVMLKEEKYVNENR